MRQSLILARSLVLVVAVSTVPSTLAAGCSALAGQAAQPFTFPNYSAWFVGPFPTSLTPVTIVGHASGPSPAGTYGGSNLWQCNAFGGSYASILYESSLALTSGQVCTFQTQGGSTCQVRGVDGLPVELLEIEID